MTYLERLIAHSPWWAEPEWARDDRSLKSVRLSNFSFRHLSRELRRPENLPPGSVSIVRGPRQVGKTTELKLLVEDLLSAGIPPRNIAYYPCDDIIHFRELMDMIKTGVRSFREYRKSGERQEIVSHRAHRDHREGKFWGWE